MDKIMTKLIGMVDSVATPLHVHTGSLSPETDLGEQAETVDTVDDMNPESEFEDRDLSESHQQQEDETGMEKPAISELAAAAKEFNTAFNVALYELDSSRKVIEERSTRINELNESIDSINSALSDEVNKGCRKEEEYRLETELLNQRVQDIESERARLNQHISEYEERLNARGEEVTRLSLQLDTLTDALDLRTAEGQCAEEEIQQLSSRLEELTATLDQRTAEVQRAQEETHQLSSQLEEVTATLDQRTLEGQHAKEEFEHERGTLESKTAELQGLFDNTDGQLKLRQKELEERDSVITRISRQVDSLTTDLDFLFEEIDQLEEANNQETTRLCADILELNNRIQTGDNQLEQQRQELESKAREVAWQNEHISELKDEIHAKSEAAQKLSDSHARECEGLNTQVSTISAELQAIQATQNETITHANKLENLNRALHESSISENELHKKVLNEKDGVIASLRAKMEATADMTNGLEQDSTVIEDLHSQLGDLESRLIESEAQRHKLEERAEVADTLEAEVEILHADLLGARDTDTQQTVDTETLRNLHDQVADLQSAVESARVEKSKLESRLADHEVLEQEVINLKEALHQSGSKSPEQTDGSYTIDALLPAQDSESISTATDRVQFLSHLNTLLAENAGSKKNETVMYILLDNFIHIRDEIGTLNSEHVINETIDIISSTCHDNEIISRVGDCTFVVLSRNESTDETKEKAGKILSAFQQNIFEVSGHSVIASTSIGICRIRDNDECAEEVISRADLACEAARSSGGNQVVLGSTVADEMNITVSNAENEALVRSTLAENRVMIYYQPISCMMDIPGIHYEVLTRVVDKSGDAILPGEFFSIAENSGQSIDIDLHVIENIMQMLAENPGQVMTMFIKLSSQTVSDHDFPLWIIGKIKKYQIDPGLLVFEIAETNLQNNLKNLSMLSKSLNNIGCKVAIEHYRMSTQSQHLMHIHTDYLKIDSGLVESLGRKGKSFSKVVAIMEVARKNNYITIAEGVESADTLAILWELGVDLAQGYFIQAPDVKRNYDFNGEESDSNPTEGSKAIFSID
jgi:diguanylate cyclase (GGDEF)-like protein